MTTGSIYKVDVRRTQWAVGHGFFHTGWIEADDTKVTYAYDCGSLANKSVARSREIFEAAKRFEKFDVVFLSHFDYDHVSGLDELAKLIRCRNFVIPLIPPEETLLRIAARMAVNVDAEPMFDAGDDWYWHLIADPEMYLREAYNAEVIVVPPGEIPEQSNAGDNFEVDLLSNAEVGNGVESAISLGDVAQVSYAQESSGDVVWEWRTFVSTKASKQSGRFVEHLLSADLIKSASDLMSPQLLQKIVLEKRDKLVEAYKETVKSHVGKSFTLNITSLMLYSGPPIGSAIRTYRRRDQSAERMEVGAWFPDPGWIGCGDAGLGVRKRAREFNSVFRSAKRYTGVFAPPHHGSHRDWHVDLIDGFGGSGSKCPTCVFGADSSYGHPRSTVTLAIEGIGGSVVTVSDMEKARWTERLSAYVRPV